MRRFSSLGIVLVVILAGPAPQWGQERTSVPDNVKSIIGRSCSVSGCHTGRYPTGNLNLEPG